MKYGAIFDMDGTLFDTESIYRQGWIEIADNFGVERKPELATAISGSNIADMPAIVHRFHPSVDEHEYVNQVITFTKDKFNKNIELMAGVLEILEYFKSQNIKMAIASSSDISIIKRNIKRADIEKYFSALVGGDQIVHGKPAPDIFLKAAEEIHLDPKDCYVFEDSMNGIRAAAAANCIPIMVIDQIEPTDEVRALCAGVYNSLIEVLEDLREDKI